MRLSQEDSLRWIQKRPDTLVDFSSNPALILCGPFHVADDQELDGTRGPFQFQPELLLQGSKDRWSGWIRRRGSRIASGGTEVGSGFIGAKFDAEVELARDPGLIDHRAVQSIPSLDFHETYRA